jgi:RHS repeat-associated protein
MHQYNANTFSFSSPYRFNAKEKDSETGLHYYGARYYQPKLSMWLSVDPLASERSWLTPYNFVQNNPITRIDPTGALDTKYVNEITRETLADTKDGSEDVVVVPKAKVENFKELVKYTPEKKLNSPEFNNNMKAGFLGFETIEGMEGYLGNASTQWSRQKLIEYRQNPTVGNWSIFLGAEVLSQNANPLNHLPSPINIKASPKLKVSPKAMIKTPAKKPNPWLLFNREMGTGKFTKENFGGSSEAAAKARRAAYDKWTTENGYLFLDNGK